MQEIDWSILKRSITNELTDDERQDLEYWRKESEDNELYYRRMERFFAGKRDEDIDVVANFKRFERKTSGKNKHIMLSVLKYTAVFILLAGIIALWQQMNNKIVEHEEQQLAIGPGAEKAVLYTSKGRQITLSSSEHRVIVVADSLNVQQDSNVLNYMNISVGDITIEETHIMKVPRGGEFSMRLSDGTMVFLNSESDLHFPVQFNGNERRVKLTGEAYFNVTKSDKPFIIEINGMEIKVLGTKLNVHAYSDEDRSETTLEQGSVEVNAAGKKMVLVPGEQAVLKKTGELSKHVVDVSLYIAWKDGHFVFDDERLEDVMNTVARWYDIQVFYQNQNVKDVRINGNISRYKDFGVLLEKLEKLDIARFEIKGNTIMVVGK